VWFSTEAKIMSQMLHECKVSCLWAEQTKGHEKGFKTFCPSNERQYCFSLLQGLVQILTLQVLEEGGGGEGLSVVSQSAK
jgi:hypothetical protein